MTADSDAYEVVKHLPNLTEAERQYLLTVARGEGFYGLGWDAPSAKTVKDSAPFGLTGHEGKDSKNWGAIMGVGTAGSFFHVDYNGPNSDIPFKGKFKAYRTNEDAAGDIASVLLKGNVKAALARNDIAGAVHAQKLNGYFGLREDLYLKAVQNNYAALTKNLGWAPLLSGGSVQPPKTPASEGQAVSLPPQSGLPQSLPSPALLTHTLPSLKLGSTGTAVLLWQKYLFSVGVAISRNGVFDTQTETYTRLYQTNRQLKIDGEVGLETWSSMFL